MTDVTSRAGSRRREQTRARLLAAAHEVFAEVGMDAASVEMICERAGFTRGAFYSNFESKNELFLALITQLAGEKLDEVAVRVRDLPTSAMTDPGSLVRQVVGVSLGDRMEPQLFSELRTQALRDPELAAANLSWQDAMAGRVEGIIRHVVDVYGLRLRLPVPDAARLLVDVSDDTCTLTTAALNGLRHIYRPGYSYKKCGVMLMELTTKLQRQETLFDDAAARAKSAKLMVAMDAVNSVWGRGTLRTGAAGMSKGWAMRSENRSPRYTTSWDELPMAK